jgi:hypothetical protein
LKGIIKTCETPVTDSDSEDGIPPSATLGYMADMYLHAHGYVASAFLHIVAARGLSNSVDDFTEYLCGKGMPTTEAQYLWKLVMLNENTA